jgi:hypothetical protein
MATPPADLWKKCRDLDFTVQREVWGISEVEGADVVVRSRPILQKLQKVPAEQGHPSAYLPSFSVVLAVDTPPKFRRAPTDPQPSSEQIAAAEKVECQFRALDEPWNEYAYDDGGPKLLKVKLVISGVSRIGDFYDVYGSPMYAINHTTVLAPPVPRKVPSGR